MKIATTKHLLILLFKILICSLAFLFILSKCSGCDHKTLQLSNNDSLNNVINMYKTTLFSLDNKLIASNKKNDSLTLLKKKVEVKYIQSSKDVRISIANGICDTIKIIETINDCDSIISLDNKIIATKDTIINYQTGYINVQKSIIAAKDEIISNKDNDIKLLKKEVKTQRRKTIAVIIGSALTLAATIFVLK